MTGDGPQKPVERFFVRCQLLSKPDVGDLHVHSRPWSPGRVFEVVYYPNGGGRWIVPEDKWDAVVSATTMIEAMALLRRG